MTGSFDSLNYGEVEPGKVWSGHKLMRITDFLKQYESSFVSEEDYIKYRITQIHNAEQYGQASGSNDIDLTDRLPRIK